MQDKNTVSWPTHVIWDKCPDDTILSLFLILRYHHDNLSQYSIFQILSAKITFYPKLLKWNPIWTNWNEILGFSSHAFELKTHSNPKWSSGLVLYIAETEYSLSFSVGFGDIFPCSVWIRAIICLSFSWLYLTIWRSTIWLFDVWKYHRIYLFWWKYHRIYFRGHNVGCCAEGHWAIWFMRSVNHQLDHIKTKQQGGFWRTPKYNLPEIIQIITTLANHSWQIWRGNFPA